MENILIEQYTAEDLYPIISLLEANNLPANDLEKNKQILFVAKSAANIIGCAAVEVYGNNALFRSLSVSESFKGKGLGQKLMNYVIEYCLDRDIQKLILLTTTADKYFERLGWKRIERSSVSGEISMSTEFSSVCPASAICMELSLTPYYSDRIFGEGFNCAQSVFVPFAVKAGLTREEAFKLTTGFGAGMVYRGETCGAITGAMMALGLNKGRSQAGDYDSRDKTYALINELYKRFKEKHNSIICKELLELKGLGHEDWETAYKEGKFDLQCPLYVKEAARIAEELIQKY